MNGPIERARGAIKRIMERFDSAGGMLLRCGRDSFGQPDGNWHRKNDIPLRIWLNGIAAPDRRRLAVSGTTYDDANAIWAVLLGEDHPPEARHGDRVALADGTLYKVLNIYRDAAGIRIFWQLEAITDERN